MSDLLSYACMDVAIFVHNIFKLSKMLNLEWCWRNVNTNVVGNEYFDRTWFIFVLTSNKQIRARQPCLSRAKASQLNPLVCKKKFPKRFGTDIDWILKFWYDAFNEAHTRLTRGCRALNTTIEESLIFIEQWYLKLHLLLFKILC